MPLPPGGQGHLKRQDLKRQENRAVLAWRGAASAGLVSSADRAYMKAPVPRPTLRLVDKVSRSCGHTPGKAAGQRSEEHTSELQSRFDLVCRLLLEKN